MKSMKLKATAKYPSRLWGEVEESAEDAGDKALSLQPGEALGWLKQRGRELASRRPYVLVGVNNIKNKHKHGKLKKQDGNKEGKDTGGSGHKTGSCRKKAKSNKCFCFAKLSAKNMIKDKVKQKTETKKKVKRKEAKEEGNQKKTKKGRRKKGEGTIRTTSRT